MKLVLAVLLFLNPLTRAELLVSNFNSNKVLRYDSTNGSFMDAFIANADGRLQQPHGLAFGPDRQLYVASAGNDRVLRYDGVTGAFIDEFIPAGSGGLDYPVALVFRNGYLYVSSQLNNRVLRYQAKTGVFVDTFVTERADLSGPSDMRFGPDNNLYVVGRFNNAIVRYNGTTGAFIDTFFTNGLSQPFGLRYVAPHWIVASGNANSILELLPSGSFVGVSTYPVGGLSLPIGLAVGPDANLYVASYANNKIARYDPFNGVSLGDFVTSGSGGLDGPNFMVFRPVDPTLSVSFTNGAVRLSWPLLNGEYSYGLFRSDSPDFSDEHLVETIPIATGGIATVVVGGGERAYFRMRTP